MLRIFFILLICLLQSVGIYAASRDTLDLSGRWKYMLTGAPSSIPGEGVITLPNTLDAAHKSVYNPPSDNTTQLRHEFSFTGEAKYSRKIEIPQEWKDKNIFLSLERTKPSRVLVDGKPAGTNSRISSVQRYDLTRYLSPGTHSIEIIVNNADSIPPIVARSSNAVSESSQTNWNGILGEILLEAKPKFNIDKIKIDDGNVPEDIMVTVSFSKGAPAGMIISGKINGQQTWSQKIKPGASSIKFSMKATDNRLWRATNPNLTELTFEIQDKEGQILDTIDILTGFRKFSTSSDYFTVNDNPVFLRGTVNAAIFPQTGYAPLDYESWLKYFSILKDYGINHVRFHSWTPPEAAFEAADKLGFYLLVELPIWGELDRDLKFHNRFLKEDLKGIMEVYSHHPSFVMFSPGNELFGDISLMGEYMNEAKRLNPRVLTTYGTNVYLGMNGQIGEEDFIVAAKTGDDTSKSVRGSVSYADSPTGGYFNSLYPGSDFNYGDATQGMTVPVISHEVGQYQSYPDFSEIEKYSGDLKPDNLEEFKKRAIEAGTYRKNSKFHEASGKWATQLYKAEMEAALRSPGIGGFELFGLQDYPGQGTAVVGILNPLMESKGFITAEEWRKSSDDLILMAEFPKFSFYENENIEIPVLLSNFTENPDTVTSISWSTLFAKGELEAIPGVGVMETGSVFLKMPKVKSPSQMNLNLTDSRGTSNDYKFWVYPKTLKDKKGVYETNNLTEALILLDQGERVILYPDSATIANSSIAPLFVNDFWNYRMYRSICDEMNLEPSPGTLGLLIDNTHPAMAKFPTESHTDWQWFPIVSNSRPLIIDRLPKDFDPIVEVIDNVERNFRLALMLECNVGKGKLMIVSIDPEKAAEYPEGEWFMESVRDYMAGKDCKPALTLTSEQVVNLVTKPSTSRLIKELKNETYSRF